MVGCGEADLSDPDLIKDATADAVDGTKLQDRNGLKYLPNEETTFTGRAEWFYENGQKFSEQNYKDGKRDGLYTSWHENGQKMEERTYKDGKADGLKTFWRMNGQKEQERNFKDGKDDGLWTEWYENGQKKSERNWKDNKMMSAEVWKPYGEKCPVTNVKDGNGVIVWYNKDGTERSRFTYKNGEQVFGQN